MQCYKNGIKVPCNHETSVSQGLGIIVGVVFVVFVIIGILALVTGGSSSTAVPQSHYQQEIIADSDIVNSKPIADNRKIIIIRKTEKSAGEKRNNRITNIFYLVGFFSAVGIVLYTIGIIFKKYN